MPRTAVLAVLAGSVVVLIFCRANWWRLWSDQGRPQTVEVQQTLPDDGQDSFPEPAYSSQATADDLTREATRVVDDLSRDFPGSLAAAHVRARLHYSLRDCTEAIRIWEQCAEREPNNAEVYLGLGAVAKESGDYNRAEEMFRRTLALAPGNDAASVALAEALMKQGKLPEAVATLDTYLQTHPMSVSAADCLGLSCLQLHDYEKACRALEESVRLNPQNRSAYYGLARAYAGLGHDEKAQHFMEEFQSLASGDGFTSSETAASREVTVASDLPLLRQIAAQTQVDVAYVYRGQGNMDKAEEMWRRAAVLDRKNTACRTELAIWFERTNREREALRMCEQLCDLEPTSADRWLDVGVLSARVGRFDAALAAVTRAIQMDPDNPRYQQAYDLIEKGK